MRITQELNLQDFEFWCGAKEKADILTDEDFRALEFILKDMYPEGMDATTLNDIFWCEEDWIAEMLGYASWEDLEYQREECA